MAGRELKGALLDIHDDILRSLGAKVVGRRTAKQWRQEDLAKVCGITRSSIANVEAGRQVPTLAVYVALCAALEMDPGPLLRVPNCTTCADAPPAGFRCLACDLAGPSVPSTKEPTE